MAVKHVFAVEVMGTTCFLGFTKPAANVFRFLWKSIGVHKTTKNIKTKWTPKHSEGGGAVAVISLEHSIAQSQSISTVVTVPRQHAAEY